MSKKISVTYDEYERYCENVDKLKFKCARWPSMEDIKNKIIPNLNVMLPYLVWVLETAPAPVLKADQDCQIFLEMILKEYYEYVETAAEDTAILSGEKLIRMTYEEYEELCIQAEESPVVIASWPSLDVLKKDGVRNFQKRLPYYLEIMEKAPTPTTQEEKDCWSYINNLIKANIVFVKE